MDEERGLARQPQRVVTGDVIEPFDACSEGNGWGPEDCQEVSPDGLHKCYDDAPWKDLGHEVYHWCGCDEQWPLAEQPQESAERFSHDEVARLGNLRTPEADAPDREEPAWMRDAIRHSVERVEDPSLRRVLLEEFHRNR